MQSVLEYHCPTIWDRPFLLDYLWSRGYRFVRAGVVLSHPETWSAVTTIEHAPTPPRALELLRDNGFAIVHYAGDVTDATLLAALGDAFDLMKRRGLSSLGDEDQRWSVKCSHWVSRIRQFIVSFSTVRMMLSWLWPGVSAIPTNGDITQARSSRPPSIAPAPPLRVSISHRRDRGPSFKTASARRKSTSRT